jgi:hypothetical protein
VFPRNRTSFLESTTRLDYLWIDFLCIIQDSIEDWEVETAKMTSIYSNALLTFTISSANEPRQPLLADRWVGDKPSFGYPPLGLIMRTDAVYVVKHKGHLFRFTPKNSRVYKTMEQLYRKKYLVELEAPLLTRAWAFQKRLLAPRTIHFHYSQMVWEYKTATR